MSSNWITLTEAVSIISKNSHHPVSSHHVQKLVSRGKIVMRNFHGKSPLLKQSDVKSVRVAIGTGNNHHNK